MRKKILLLILIILVLVLLYKAAITKPINLAIQCVVADHSGTMIDSGTMIIKGAIIEEPFTLSKLRLDDFGVPHYSVTAILKKAAWIIPPLADSQYHKAIIDLDIDEIGMQTCSLQFSEDGTVWILFVADKIIVGSTKENADYASIIADLAGLQMTLLRR